jgi:hypothetical protein
VYEFASDNASAADPYESNVFALIVRLPALSTLNTFVSTDFTRVAPPTRLRIY